MRIDEKTAKKLLKDSQVVAMPTETVYGLAAALNSPTAIAKIFSIKGRPLSNPLIIHIASVKDIIYYAEEIPPFFHLLAENFWPGPLTLIVPVKTNLIPANVRANLPTAGFRMPHQKDTLHVIRSIGPLVMPSANLSGKPSSTRPEHIEEDFGIEFPVLDGGICSQGVESTILLYKDARWIIVRLGALPPEAFLPILGYPPQIFEEGDEVKKPICPGQHFRHYAPKAKLLFGSQDNAEYIIGFKERDYPSSKKMLYLSSLENPAEAAENLYHILRQLDLEHALSAWIDTDFPRTGLWLTIHERLERAAQK